MTQAKKAGVPDDVMELAREAFRTGRILDEDGIVKLIMQDRARRPGQGEAVVSGYGEYTPISVGAGTAIGGPTKCEFCHGTGQPGGVMGGPELGVCGICGGTGRGGLTPLREASLDYLTNENARLNKENTRLKAELKAAEEGLAEMTRSCLAERQSRLAPTRAEYAQVPEGMVLVDIEDLEFVSEIANRNEQSFTGDHLALLIANRKAATPAGDKGGER